VASLALSGFFVYVANSSFALTAHYDVSPHSYALLFALNAVAFVVVSQANGWLARRIGLPAVLRFAALGQFVAVALLLALLISGLDRLELLVAQLAIVYGLNGAVVPATFVLTMEGNPGWRARLRL
jgi:DHA1 family bicyclomycin/chloramphenicol resistance-like MFS transporter